MTVVEEKITLDKEVFKTLASGTRIDIIKSLDRRRKTLSELSKQFGMSVSTVKEHLDNLVSVGLIEQKDEGHKWKYYELTKKGKDILHPEDKKIWILLGVSVLAMIVIGFDMVKNSMLAMGSFANLQAAAPKMEEAVDMGTRAAAAPLPELPYLHIAGFIVFGVLLLLSLAYVIHARRNIRV
jgi:DNA-binding transcriptional ArsR family regulator